jgi:hypothetical protein
MGRASTTPSNGSRAHVIIERDESLAFLLSLSRYNEPLSVAPAASRKVPNRMTRGRHLVAAIGHMGSSGAKAIETSFC